MTTSDVLDVLPPEVIDIVVQYCCTKDIPYCCSDDDPRGSYNKWINIADCRLVSKKWKSYFESIPFLWNDIALDESCIEVADFVLPIVNRQSKGCELYVDISNALIEKLSRLPSSFFSNLETLSIHGSHEFSDEISQAEFEQKTLNFVLYLNRVSGGLKCINQQSVHKCVVQGDGVVIHSSPPAWSAESLALVTQNCQSLRHLIFSGVDYLVFENWLSLPLSLRTLSLTYIPDDVSSPEFSVSSANWEFNPHMETIEIHSDIAPRTISFPSSVKKLDLDIGSFLLAPDSGPFDNLVHLALGPQTSYKTGLSFVEKGATNLEYLDTHLPRKAVLFLCRNNPNLKALHMCPHHSGDPPDHFTEDDFRQIASWCPQLETITINLPSGASHEIYYPLFQLENIKYIYAPPHNYHFEAKNTK